MPRPRSINQNIIFQPLPNFRNLGVVLRLILWVNGLALLLAVFHAQSWLDIAAQMLNISTVLQPVLLGSLALLHWQQPQLQRLPYWLARLGVVLVVSMLAVLIANLGGYWLNIDQADFFNAQLIIISVTFTELVLGYFRLRERALSPAFSAARLQALQARIRPHFLFNTLNAVLGIVRTQPKRAEQALEDLADLFRMAMADAPELVPLSHELALARQYLDLETLRLGDRLRVKWQLENLPTDALIPPLILQPLLENAVYHGIEPMADGAEISIKIARIGKEIHLDVYNPRPQKTTHLGGNKIALANIRERLALQFDLEADYKVTARDDDYRVHIMIPYRREKLP